MTYFLEVVSSWCHWAEPAWADLKRRYSGRVQFEWKIALMPPEAFPVSVSQCEWFYAEWNNQSVPLHAQHGLVRKGCGAYLVPNHVAEAARAMGVQNDEVRLALSWPQCVRAARWAGGKWRWKSPPPRDHWIQKLWVDSPSWPTSDAEVSGTRGEDKHPAVNKFPNSRQTCKPPSAELQFLVVGCYHRAVRRSILFCVRK